MLHALRNHWQAFETNDPAVTMYIGPAMTAEPLEVGVQAANASRASRPPPDPADQ